jgi:plasmid maintenance system antidote protein VapI
MTTYEFDDFVEKVEAFLAKHEHWNQNRLAKQVDISRQHIWYCIRGKRPFSERLQARIETLMALEEMDE